jgi:predicted TIM-barrel fold metal-dependent hydrolase
VNSWQNRGVFRSVSETACIHPILYFTLLVGLCLQEVNCHCPTNAPTADQKTITPQVPSVGPAWRPGYVRPGVIDVHTHIMPSGLERLVSIQSDNGLTHVVNLSGGSPGKGAEVSVRMQTLWPSMSHFYNPNWALKDLTDFGEREANALDTMVRNHGFRGLKISKALGLYLTLSDGSRMPVDWPGLDPLWAKAGELGVPVAIHTGDPLAFWQPLEPSNERYEELALHPSWSFHGPQWPARETLLAERNRMISKHPKTTFICVHFGNNPESLEDVDRLLTNHPNVVLDTSARLGEIGRHPPERVRAFFIKHQDRILFGTDLGLSRKGIMLGSTGAIPPQMNDVKPFYEAHWRFFEGKERGIPHPTPVQGRWTIDAIDLPTVVLEKIYAKNALRVLQLDLNSDAQGREPTKGPLP